MTLPAPPRPSPPPLGRRPLNLHTVQQWVDEGRLPTDRVITMADLRGSDCVGRKMGWGVKLLGEGAEGFDTPLHIQVGGCCCCCCCCCECCGGDRSVVEDEAGEWPPWDGVVEDEAGEWPPWSGRGPPGGGAQSCVHLCLLANPPPPLSPCPSPTAPRRSAPSSSRPSRASTWTPRWTRRRPRARSRC